MVDEGTKIWAAGAFDGEGCAVIAEYTGTTSLRIVVNVGNTDPRLVKRFHMNWGGTVYTYPEKSGHRTFHYVQYDRPEAKRLLTDLMGYLTIKKEAAALVLRAIDAHEKHKMFSRDLLPFYIEGIKRGLWGSRLKDGHRLRKYYNTQPHYEVAAASDYLSRAVEERRAREHRMRGVIDLSTGVEYRSRYKCGLALAREFGIKANTLAWYTIYSRCPKRFQIVG